MKTISKTDVSEGQELFTKNVKEENEKNIKEMENSTFDLNSRRNLISVARETLKPKIYSYNSKYQGFKSFSPKKKYHSNLDRVPFNIKFAQNSKNILDDKHYLNFMVKELKTISTRFQKRQRRFNPSLKYGNSFEKKNYSTIKRNYKIANLKTINLSSKRKCNEVNLLNQIIGDPSDDENLENYDYNNENGSYEKNGVDFFFTEIAKNNKVNLSEGNNNNIYLKFKNRNIPKEKKKEEINNENFLYLKKGYTTVDKLNKAVKIKG